MRTPQVPSHVTTAEVCQRLRLRRRQTVQRYIRDGRLRGRKVGRQWLIERSSVDALLGVNA